MKLDMVNFTISHMRPHIQQHSVEYEKSKFQEILHSLESEYFLVFYEIAFLKNSYAIL